MEKWLYYSFSAPIIIFPANRNIFEDPVWKHYGRIDAK